MVNERDGLEQQALDLRRGLDPLVTGALQARPAAAGACLRVRALLEAGDVDGAMAALADVCLDLVQAGGTYRFKLVKQKFVELCSSSGSDSAAIVCARDELAPVALDAYPEAYEEFKVCLQLLVYTKELQRQQHETLRHICGQAGRSQLAAAVYHAAMQALAGLQEPTLVRLLTYLLRLHQVHRATLTDSQLQEQELVDRLLLPGKDAAPFPCEGGLSSFREADIQALIHCAGASRREAMEALRRCNGDVQQAFSQELSRLRLDRVLLGQLLEEYVVFRGLQLPEPAAHCKTGSSSSGSATASGAAPWVPLPCSEAAAAAAPGTDAPAAGSNGHEPMDMVLGAQQHSSSGLQPSGQDAAGAGGRAASHAAAGTSGPCATHPSVRQNLHILHPDRSDTQSPPTKVPRCSASGVGAQPSLLGNAPSAAAPSSLHRPVDTRLRELPHVVNDLAKEGQVPQVIQAVQELDPSFFDAHPQLLFELRRCEFLQLLDTGDTTKALHFTRTQLAPAAERHEALQPALKATTAMLLGVGQREPAAAALQTAAGNLQAALRVHMGMHGPQLIRLLQVLLAVHRAWLRREKFNDPFQAALAIDALRDVNAASVAAAAAALPSAQQRNDPDLTSLPDLSLASSDEEDRQAAVDEERILRVMEVLEIPRRTALDLLVHHDGDVEAAIMSSL